MFAGAHETGRYSGDPVASADPRTSNLPNGTRDAAQTGDLLRAESNAPDHVALTGGIVRTAPRKAPLRGAAVIGGRDEADVVAQLTALSAEATAGRAPAPAAPDPALAGAAIRVAID
jgi:hypothetical protein